MSSFMLLTSIQSTTTDKIFTNDRITTLLSDENEKFDAVIFESFFNDMVMG